MGENSRKGPIAAIAAAAVMMIGGAWFGVGFYRNAPREPAKAEIVHREPKLPEISASGSKKTAEDSREDSSREDSRPESRTESSRTESNAESSAAPKEKQVLTQTESGADTVIYTERTEVPQERDESSRSDSEKTVTDEKLPDAGTPAKTVSDGKEADREYFTTSIKDGETVSESTYFFTITHLIDDLEAVRSDVELNGALLTGYAGKCRLTEGENSIRVSCTYKDDGGRIYRAFRDYTVYLESREAPILTDLKDCTVFDPVYSFSAECENGLEVTLNGQRISGDGRYTVTLNEGENIIRLISGRQGLDFSVMYVPLQGVEIFTDLDDRTVHSEKMTFTAQAAGGKSPKLTVQLNGKTLRGNDGSYTALLKEGTNTIRLLATDSTEKTEKTFTVIFLPDEEEDRLPHIEEINLTDNMTVKGSSYSLTLRAGDCEGRRIYSDGIEVACGGTAAGFRWEDAYSAGYLLTLHPGENSVFIRLTDSIGRRSEFLYRINCEAAETGEEVGRIAISVRADVLGLGALCEDSSFPVLEGETGFDTMARFLEENGFEVSARGGDSSRYLARITKQGAFAQAALTESALEYLSKAGLSVNSTSDPDSLGEFDYTPGAGWLYSRNGKKPSYAMSATVFSDGEDIQLIFSLDFGNDTDPGY